MREHNAALNRLDFMEDHEEITADYEPGAVELVTQHYGSILKLRKLHAHYDPTDRAGALAYLHERAAEGEIVTGLLYVDPEPKELHDYLNTAARPLNRLSDDVLVPGAKALDAINAGLR